MPVQPPDIPDKTEMAHAQSIRYARDLVHVYEQERIKRRELEIANQKLRAVWATAPNGLAVLDEQMLVVEANPRFEAFVEHDGPCAGHHLTDLLPSDNLAATLAAAAREGTPFASVELTLTRPGGRTLQVTGAPLASGDQRGWVISVFDLTERKRLEGLKKEFIDIAAHELRTPLAIILGFASVVSEDMAATQDQGAMAPIEAIVGAANRLKTIINELVEFAAARTHATGQAVDQFDLCQLVGTAVSTLSHQANQAGVEIVVQIARQPMLVRGDRVILAQALAHLLENGIRYNRPNGRVYVRFSQQEEGGSAVEIEDTGIGIPATELESIFDLFYQVEEHMTRARGGLGMGLPIARRAFELHGGRIHVSSTVGKGSCFRVTFPPPSQQLSILAESRLDSAHRQTLAYGKDLARAFTAERNLGQRMQRVSDMCRQLDTVLGGRRIEEAHRLVQQIADEASAKGDLRGKGGR